MPVIHTIGTAKRGARSKIMPNSKTARRDSTLRSVRRSLFFAAKKTPTSVPSQNTQPSTWMAVSSSCISIPRILLKRLNVGRPLIERLKLRR